MVILPSGLGPDSLTSKLGKLFEDKFKKLDPEFELDLSDDISPDPSPQSIEQSDDSKPGHLV